MSPLRGGGIGPAAFFYGELAGTMRKWKVMLAAGALSLAATLPAAAATLKMVDGILTGASGVTVATAAGTKTYDVEFLDGSCVSLFSSCAADPASSSLPAFAFTTLADATAASQSLLDQVFLDVIAGSFDSNPDLTRGCSWINVCTAITPFEFTFAGGVNAALADNYHPPFLAGDGIRSRGGFIPTGSTTGSGPVTFAVWTEVTPIPLPAGAPLVLSGLAAFAGLAWRKRRERLWAEV